MLECFIFIHLYLYSACALAMKSMEAKFMGFSFGKFDAKPAKRSYSSVGVIVGLGKFNFAILDEN